MHIICKAGYQDIDSIVEICRQNLLSNKKSDKVSKQGFLMSEMTKDYAKNMIDRGDVILVAKRDKIICGYLTAGDLKSEDTNFYDEVLKINGLGNAKIIYHKQIAKSLNEVGVGKNLLLTMFDEARIRGYSHVVCKIVLHPFYNQASVNFHEKSGFVKMAELQEVNRMVGVFVKKL